MDGGDDVVDFVFVVEGWLDVFVFGDCCQEIFGFDDDLILIVGFVIWFLVEGFIIWMVWFCQDFVEFVFGFGVFYLIELQSVLIFLVKMDCVFGV